MRHPPGYRDRAPFAAPLLSGWPSLISSSTPSNPTDTTTSLPNCGCAQSRMSTSSSATPPRCFPPWPPDSTPPLRPSSTLTPLGKLPPSQGRDILHHRQLQSRRNPRRRLPGTRRSRLCLRRLRPRLGPGQRLPQSLLGRRHESLLPLHTGRRREQFAQRYSQRLGRLNYPPRAGRHPQSNPTASSGTALVSGTSCSRPAQRSARPYRGHAHVQHGLRRMNRFQCVP